MVAKKPDVRKLKKKHQVVELVEALRHEDVNIRAQAAQALGEIGGRAEAIEVMATVDELSARGTDAGAWDPSEGARAVLRSWAVGASTAEDPSLRESAAKARAAVERQEEARRGVLLGDVQNLTALREGLATVELAESLNPPVIEEPIAAPPEPLEAALEDGEGHPSPNGEDRQKETEIPATLEGSIAAAAGLDTPPPAADPTPALVLQGHNGEISTVAVMADGSSVVSASWDGTLRIWDLGTGSGLHTLRGHGPGYIGLALAIGARRAVSASADGTLRVWDLDAGRGVHSLGERRHEACLVALTPDGSLAISGSFDGGVRVWEVDSGRCAHALEGHQGTIEFLAVTADGLRVVSGSTDGTVRVWDLTSGVALRELGGHKKERLLAVVPDGSAAVTCDAHGTLRVWDPLTGGILHAHQVGEAAWVSAGAVTPDGRTALLCCWGGGLLLFDLGSGQVEALEGHADDVTAIVVTGDGSRFVSGSKDGQLIVWDLPAGTQIQRLPGHAGLITALANTPDGSRLVSGSSDGTLLVWDPPPKETETAAEAAGDAGGYNPPSG